MDYMQCINQQMNYVLFLSIAEVVWGFYSYLLEKIIGGLTRQKKP